MKQKRILLYPGGFKPFHDGHFSLLNKVIYHYDINELYIITSNKSRDNIDDTVSYDIINACMNYFAVTYNVICHYISISGSPIAECYKIVNNSNDDEIFALLSSNKTEKDYKRTLDFYNGYKIDGKYNKDNRNYNKAFEIDVDDFDSYFSDRTDEYNNSHISASILRNDIKNNDYTNFKAGYRIMKYYRIINDNMIKKLFSNNSL